MSEDGARREEILETAASMFATSGMRTTLREIGDACGILPGSLYHHFASKEAIIVELVQRYRDDLDQVAKEALAALHEPDAQPVEERIIAFGEAVAACAVRHRAALLLTLYEPPTVAGEELVELAGQTPKAVDAAMVEILQAGRTAGVIRAGIDLSFLAERIVQSMLHMAVGVFHKSRAAQHLPAEKCRMYLHGVMVREPRASLDRSAAMKAARRVVAGWEADGEDDPAAHLRAVARAEFGRRGFETTTIRDIAKAAGTSTGSVYRRFGSKDELLVAIMSRYADSVLASWNAVMRSDSTSLERLDAVLWVNANVLHHFYEEYKIQLAWLRVAPPTSVGLGLSFDKSLRQLQRLVTEGEKAGELRVEGGSALTKARSLFELSFTPEDIVRALGPDGAHQLARETILRGALAKR